MKAFHICVTVLYWSVALITIGAIFKAGALLFMLGWDAMGGLF